jgi:hypothetical protein
MGNEGPACPAVSICAKVEMPGISFLVTCCADTATPVRVPITRTTDGRRMHGFMARISADYTLDRQVPEVVGYIVCDP